MAVIGGRISLIAVRLGEGPMSDHAADVQPERRERVFVRPIPAIHFPNRGCLGRAYMTFDHLVRPPRETCGTRSQRPGRFRVDHQLELALVISVMGLPVTGRIV
jgi:hypothetical protein